jgi:hypothetical protein
LKERSDFVKNNLGNFEYIWPLDEAIDSLKGTEKDIQRKKDFILKSFNEPYAEFLLKSEANYHNFTGADLVKVEKKMPMMMMPPSHQEGFNSFQVNLSRVEKIYSASINNKQRNLKTSYGPAS